MSKVVSRNENLLNHISIWLQENELVCFRVRKKCKEFQKVIKFLCIPEYPRPSPVMCMWGAPSWCRSIRSLSSLPLHRPPDPLSPMFRLVRSLQWSVWWVRRLADACCNATKHRGQHCGQHCREHCREQRDSSGHRHGSCSAPHPSRYQNHRRRPWLLTGQPDWR